MAIIIQDKLGKEGRRVEALSRSHALQWVSEFREQGHEPFVYIDGKSASVAELEAMPNT